MNHWGKVGPWLLPLAIATGLGLGWGLPQAGQSFGALIDPLLFGLLVLLFVEVRFHPLRHATRHLRFLSIAWIANFILIPLAGWGIASLFFPRESALFVGLLLYFLFPCTDWFLGFTRIAKGDVALGTVLLPVNLITQLILFPVYLSLITGFQSGSGSGVLNSALAQWFFLPLSCALVLRLIVARLGGKRSYEKVSSLSGNLVHPVIAAVALCLFVQNTATLTANPLALLKILLAVSLFFVVSWILSELLARCCRLSQAQHVLLAMTTAARNAPLILGLTMVAIPDQPLIHAALIIGLLVEFPHLIALSHLFLRKTPGSAASPDHSATDSTFTPHGPTHET